MSNLILRLLSLSFYFGGFLYWSFGAGSAQKEKPKKELSFSWRRLLSKVIFTGFEVFVMIQLLGARILPMPDVPSWFPYLGFLLVLLGIGISVAARYALHTNWTGAAEYQIKNNHTLITHGIYHFVRHPIYVGMGIAFIGSEMVVGSYLFISMFAFFIAAYVQGKREEKILLSHFGSKYKIYMKHSKMLIPFIF